MMMNWKSCLTYHHDETPRIHLPLITNDGCFMIIDGKVEKLHEECHIPRRYYERAYCLKCR